MRLLYNSDNNNNYYDLRSRGQYQTNYTSKVSNTDYIHKFFSNIRNNHRYLKSQIKKGSEMLKTEQEILFSGGEVKEYYQSKPYFYLRTNTNHFLDTLHQVVVYDNSKSYDSYESIEEKLVETLVKIILIF